MPRHPEVHFRLKPKTIGKRSIYLQFVYNGNRLFYSFGQTINPSDWNEKTECVKKKTTTTADGKFALNDLLDNLKNLCEKSYNESLKNGIPAPGVIKKILQNFLNQNHSEIDPSKPTFFSLASRFINGEIKNRGKDKSKSTLENYSAATKHLKDFQNQKKYPVSFESINLDFFYKYTSFLKDKLKLSPNSIAKDISIIKVFMGEAVDLGYKPNMDFRTSKFSFREIETDAIYLTEQELIDLYNYDLSFNKKLDQVKDLFVVGAWLGLRFSDLSNIKSENIVKIDGDYFVKMITKKTNELVIIPCHPIVLEIFDKYNNNPNKLPRTISNQKFNAYIKNVCELAKLNEKGRLSTRPSAQLWECVSSHTARRSFATNYYLQGFPIIDLMKITGHKSEKAFLTYIRVTKLDTAKRLSAHIKKSWSEKMMRVA